jgi:hypothetical protein
MSDLDSGQDLSVGGSVGAASEQMIPQSKVGQLITREKHDSYDKGYQRGISEAAAQNTSLSKADVEAIIESKADAIAQRAEEKIGMRVSAHQTQAEINDFVNRVTSYDPKLIETLKSQDFGNTPGAYHLVKQLKQFDNMGEIVEELAKKPRKMMALITGAQLNGTMNMESIKEISESLKQNTNALKSHSKAAAEPLSQVTSSSIGRGDSGKALSFEQISALAKQRR